MRPRGRTTRSTDGKQHVGDATGRCRWDTQRLASGLISVLAMAVASGSVLAHSGHGHEDAGGAGSLLVPLVLFGSAAVLGAAVYVERSGDVDGRLTRAGVLLGVVGLLVGLLLALF